MAKPSIIRRLSSLGLSIAQIAKSSNKTSAQILLNWSKSGNVFPLFNTTNLSHLEQDVECLGWSLTRPQIKQIDSAVASFLDRRPTSPDFMK
jgi:diketogulonate reductase-like aldo/keto reductase